MTIKELIDQRDRLYFRMANARSNFRASVLELEEMTDDIDLNTDVVELKQAIERVEKMFDLFVDSKDMLIDFDGLETDVTYIDPTD